MAVLAVRVTATLCRQLSALYYNQSQSSPKGVKTPLKNGGKNKNGRTWPQYDIRIVYSMHATVVSRCTYSSG